VDDEEDEDIDAIIFRNLWKNYRMLPPTSVAKSRWDIVMFIFVFYNSIYIPLELAFEDVIEKHVAHCVIDYLIDIMFVIDMVINFRTTYFNAEQELVLDKKTIALRYIRTWFPIDLVAVIPFELFFLMFGASGSVCGGDGGGGAGNVAGIFKILRLLRLGRVMKVLDKLSGANIVRFIYYLVAFLLVAHLLACLWWVVGKTKWDEEERDTPPYDLCGEEACSWLRRVPQDSTELHPYKSPFAQQYWSSMYWSLTMLMKTPWTGPDTIPEKIVGVIAVLLGSVLLAALLTFVQGLWASVGQGSAKKRDRTATVLNFAKRHSVPAELQSRLLKYLNQHWAYTAGMDRNNILAQLPSQLRAMAVQQIYKDTLLHTPIFEAVSGECCKLCMLALQPQICISRDLLIIKGQLVDKLYFLMRGSLQVTTEAPSGVDDKSSTKPTGEPSGSMRKSTRSQKNMRMIERPGAFIGFIDPDSSVPGKYPVFVQATADTQLMALSRADLSNILSCFPGDDKNELLRVLATDHRGLLETLKVTVEEGTPLYAYDKMIEEKAAAEQLRAAGYASLKGRVGAVESQLASALKDLEEIGAKMDLIPEIAEMIEATSVPPAPLASAPVAA